MYGTLIVLGVFTMIYSIFAGRIERSWISGPIIFVVFGVLIARTGLHFLPTKPNAEMLIIFAELTLALILFIDAAETDLGVLRQSERLPIRLLAIGLPLTILLGAVFGWMIFPSLTLLEIALLATILAPTDAALGKGVITNPVVPNKVRQGLNVESGFNDGICVPILFLFLALVESQTGGQVTWQTAVMLFVESVGIGLLVGVGITVIAVVLLRVAVRRDWLSSTWRKITVISVAFSCFGIAQALGGSGFIACFAGGLLFGGLLKEKKKPLLGAAEGIGDTFSLLTWILFGAAVVTTSIMSEFSWPALLYALLSLTIIRMLPVFLALTGLKSNIEGKLFVGWFGPRGLASIVFAVIVLHAKLPHGHLITTVVVYTVLLSILLHGLTSNPWAKGFGSRWQKFEPSLEPKS